jgi:hypothetical protein
MHRQPLLAILFPPEPRSFPFRRTVQIALRTLHLFCAGVLVGAYLFSQPEEILNTWVLATVASGLMLLSTDLHASMIYLFEGRGLAVLVKISLTSLISVLPQHALPLLLSIFMIGSFSSHAPRRYRHKLSRLGNKLKVMGQRPKSY